jgi:hypothetical protein
LERKRRDIVRMEPKTKFVVFAKPTYKKTLSTTEPIKEELERKKNKKKKGAPKKKGGPGRRKLV